MSDSVTIKSQKEAVSPAFVNVVTVLLMYGVIILFYVQKMRALGPGNRNSDVWMDTLVEAVGISTFTYVLPAAIQNTFQRLESKVVRHSILLLVSDVLYVFLYALFPPRPLFLNIILCVLTVALVFWTSLVIYWASKSLASGQAMGRIMRQDDKRQLEESSDSQVLDGSENNRIT